MCIKILIGDHCFNSKEELESIQRLATRKGLVTMCEFEQFIKDHFSKN